MSISLGPEATSANTPASVSGLSAEQRELIPVPCRKRALDDAMSDAPAGKTHVLEAADEDTIVPHGRILPDINDDEMFGAYMTRVSGANMIPDGYAEYWCVPGQSRTFSCRRIFVSH